jgi:hypothetical protein
MNRGVMIKTNVLHCTRVYIEIVEGKILFGQRLWDIDKVVDPLVDELELTPLKVEYLKGQKAPLNWW